MKEDQDWRRLKIVALLPAITTYQGLEGKGCGQGFVLPDGVEKWGVFTCPCCWNVTRNTKASQFFEANKIVDVVAGKGEGMLCTHND